MTFDERGAAVPRGGDPPPGQRGGTAGAVSLLHRLVPKLWRAFPDARLRVRLDAGLATPEILAHLEWAGAEYVVAIASNTVLAPHAEPWVALLRPVVALTRDTATTYDEAAYRAGIGRAAARDHQGRRGVAPWARAAG